MSKRHYRSLTGQHNDRGDACIENQWHLAVDNSSFFYEYLVQNGCLRQTYGRWKSGALYERLVAKDYNEIEGLDFEEIFSG